MFNPFQNYVDPIYFYHLATNAPYFNYDHFMNRDKISSNIILAQNEYHSPGIFFKEQKFQEAKIDQYPVMKVQQVQKVQIIKKPKIKSNTGKQVARKNKQKRIVKPAKKVDLVQKQGRNSHSNILRKFFKLLSVKNQFAPTIQKIIKKYGFDIDVEGFFKQVKERNTDHRNYIRVREVKWLFEENQNSVYKITRILFKNYLKSFYVGHLLSSKKTNNRLITFHLKGIRTIREEIIGKTNSQEGHSQSYEN